VGNVVWDPTAPQPTLHVTYTRSAASTPAAPMSPTGQAPRPSDQASVGRTVGRTVYLAFLAAVTVTLVVIGIILVMRNEGPLSCIFGAC
jgi:hypothetical protein